MIKRGGRCRRGSTKGQLYRERFELRQVMKWTRRRQLPPPSPVPTLKDLSCQAKKFRLCVVGIRKALRVSWIPPKVDAHIEPAVKNSQTAHIKWTHQIREWKRTTPPFCVLQTAGEHSSLKIQKAWRMDAVLKGPQDSRLFPKEYLPPPLFPRDRGVSPVCQKHFP